MDNNVNSQHWITQIEQITKRSDLNGLLKYERRYKPTPGDDYGTGERADKKLVVGDSLFTSLIDLCSAHGLSLDLILQFVWHKVLSIYGNGDHTVVATVLSNSSWNHLQTIRSCALPVIVDHHQQHLQLCCIDAMKVLEANVSRLISDREFVELDRLKLDQFDSLLVFTDVAKMATGDELMFFPLTLYVCGTTGNESGIILTISYIASMFDDDCIGQLLDVVDTLLSQVVINSTLPVADLEFLPEHQRRTLEQWNCTDGDYPSSKRLHHLFEEAVERTPDKAALLHEGVQLTYRTLNEQSNRLANYLHTLTSVKPEELVALFLDKSDLMITTIIGIWKSGAAYVPIDPAYPDERVVFILDDMQTKIVIANQRYVERLNKLSASTHIIAIEQLLPFLASDLSANVNKLRLELTSNQLAYATYTSGTTGVPKAISKQHNSLVNSITDLAEKYKIGETAESIVLFSGYVFEPFVRQMLMALLNNQLLVIVNDDEKLDRYEFPQFLKRHNITYLNGTASVLREFDYSDCPMLSKLLLVGENLTESHYKKLRQTFKRRIINEYGFTESAFVTAIKEFESDDDRTDRSIGRPLRNVKCYVLSNALKQVPIGAVGELYIGGNGVSSGYLNRPELTTERFLSNHFQTQLEKLQDVNGRIYKTGDLARWLPNGDVEYLGRNDFQVKIRGVRIEPGEIETVVCAYQGIKHCVVIAKTMKNSGAEFASQCLVGYYVEGSNPVAEADLLSYLETKLPRYMIPTRMIRMKRMPVTVNGKVDLRALEDICPSFDVLDDIADVRNSTDSDIRNIWSETLGIPAEHIGINHDFFKLGGNSLTCIQIIIRIRQTLNMAVTVQDIFSLRTIAKLSDCLLKNHHSVNQEEAAHNLTTETYVTLPASDSQSDVDGYFIANSLQRRIIQMDLQKSAFDDTHVLHSLHEYNTAIDPGHMRSAWEFAQYKFATLRLRFSLQDVALQIIEKKPQLDWRFIDLAEHDLTVSQIQKLDAEDQYLVESGRLFRIYLIKHHEKHFSLLFSCHHIIMDYWSLFVLYDYVHDTYLQIRAGVQVVPERDEAYCKVQQYLQEHRNDHVEYWTNKINQIGDRADLSCLLKKESQHCAPLINYIYVKLHKVKGIVLDDVCKLLRNICMENGITLHCVLQFVWHKVIHAYGKGRQTVVGTVVSGRNEPITEIDKSVGLFINTLPLIVDHDNHEGQSVFDAIRDIQSEVIIMNCRCNVEIDYRPTQFGQTRLFESIFVMHNSHMLDRTKEQFMKKSLCMERKILTGKVHVPFMIVARETENNGARFDLSYASELFDDAVIDELLNAVHDMLRQIANDIHQPVVSLKRASNGTSHTNCMRVEQFN